MPRTLIRAGFGPGPRAAGRRGPPGLLLLGLYVVAIGGRFTLDRIGLDEYEDVDLAVLGGTVVAVAVLVWRFHPAWDAYRPVVPVSGRWALAVIGYLGLTAFWAPPGADILETLSGLLVLAVFVLAVPVLFGPDPERARRLILWAVLVSGVVYALSALVVGDTDVQGRATAFGGGANVFARVVCLGGLAAVALAALYRRWWLMLVLPLMAVTAVLAGSRGAFVSVGVMLAVFVVLFPRRISLRVVVPLAGVVALGAAVMTTFFRSRVDEIVQERFLSAADGDSDYSGRPALIDAAWRIFETRPLAGAGLDSFRVLYGWASDLGYPHNLVAEIASTGGMIGLFLLGGFLVGWVRDCRPFSNLTTTQIALVLAAIFVLTSSMFSGDLYDTRFFWIFALAAVAPTVSWSSRPGT